MLASSDLVQIVQGKLFTEAEAEENPSPIVSEWRCRADSCKLKGPILQRQGARGRRWRWPKNWRMADDVLLLLLAVQNHLRTP